MPNIVSGSIVYARPPGKRALPPRAPIAAEGDPALPPLTPSAALVTFAKLVGAWAMPPARGWRMLTGVGYRAGSLTADQAARVGYLVAIDAAIRKIGGQPAGVWMVTGNPAPILGGSARRTTWLNVAWPDAPRYGGKCSVGRRYSAAD